MNALKRRNVLLVLTASVAVGAVAGITFGDPRARVVFAGMVVCLLVVTMLAVVGSAGGVR